LCQSLAGKPSREARQGKGLAGKAENEAEGRCVLKGAKRRAESCPQGSVL
jgi:hypothetical protein